MSTNVVAAQHYHVDRGLEGVLPFKGSQEAGLPVANNHVLPAEASLNRHLETLLRAPDVNQILLQSLKDELGDPELMLPGVHRELLADVGQELEIMSAAFSDPRERKIINRAAGLLRGELELMNLLDHYRSALHKA